MTPSADRMATRLATRLSFFAAGFTMACWAPIVPFAKARIGVDDSEMGLLVLCLGIGSILSMPVTGILTARLGSKPMVLAGGIGMALCLPALAAAGTYVFLAVALLGFGASLGTIDVAMNVHAVEVERASKQPLMSGFHALFSIGGLAGSAGTTLLLSQGAAPLSSALCASGLTLVAMTLAWPRLLSARGGPPVPLAMPRGAVLLLACLICVMFFTEGAVLDWGALLVIDAELASPEKAGLGYVLFSTAMTIGRLSGDRMVAAAGNARVLLVGGTVAVAGLVVLLAVPVPLVAMSGFFLLGLGSSNIVPVLFTLAGNLPTVPASLAVAAVTTTGYAGILAGPALIGFLAKLMGLHAAFGVVAAAVCLVPLFARRAARG